MSAAHPLSHEADESSVNLRVERHAHGAPLIISFGFASWTEAPTFDFDGRIKKLAGALNVEFSRILLKDPFNLWYERGLPEISDGVGGLIARLQQLILSMQPGRTIVIGQSMGAYAAIRYGLEIGADAVIAFGPQSWLDARLARELGDLRWLPVMEQLDAKQDPAACLDLLTVARRRAGDHPTAVHVLYGLANESDPSAPANLDAWHAARLAALAETRLHPFPAAPHNVVGWLQEQGQLDDVLAQLVRPVLADNGPIALRSISPAPLAPGWRQWVAENRLRGCSPESMVDGMVERGVPRPMAKLEVDEITTNPVYLAAQKFISLKTKLESVLASQQALWETAPDYEVVEQRSAIGREEFFRRYYLGCRPVVVKGLVARWPAMARWQPAALAERFGDCEVEVQAGREADENYEVNSVQLKTRFRFRDFLHRVVEGGPSNDVYLTANNHVFADPAFAGLHEDIGAMPAYLDPAEFSRHGSWWVGPAGAVTPLHHDTLMLFHAQVVGRKRWRMISPLQIARVYNHREVFSAANLDSVDYDRHPLLRGLRVLDVIVEPGDAIFLPLAWWHQVTSLDVTVSISFSNLAFPNSFDYVNPQIRDW